MATIRLPEADFGGPTTVWLADPDRRLLDPQEPAVQVHVRPAQRHRLAAAQPDQAEQQVQQVQPVVLIGVEEPRQLRCGPGLAPGA